MKLIIDQLGRIDHAEIDIRPLTVLIGKNGTNKTWVAHSYFKLLERLRVEASLSPASSADPASTLAGVIAADWAAKIKKSQPGAVSFSLGRAELVSQLPETVSFNLQGAVWQSTLGARLPPSACVALHLGREELQAGAATRIEVTVGQGPLTVETSLYLEGEPEPRKTTAYPDPKSLRSVLRQAVESLLCGWRRHVRALPAERVNLAQIFPVLIRNKDVLMPRALVDFCYMMSLASAASLPPPDSTLTEALVKVAGGRLSFESGELVFRPLSSGDVALPLKAAASLTKAIAGLGVFLSTATRRDVVIIDEPEMNAHPESQVALVNLFAAMLRQGIEVVIVTHSPYILDHITTLLEASRLDSGPRSEVGKRLALGSPDLYIDPQELAVYQFETSGEVRSVLDRENGVIDWSTFTAVSDRESTIVNALIDAEESGSGAG